MKFFLLSLIMSASVVAQEAMYLPADSILTVNAEIKLLPSTTSTYFRSDRDADGVLDKADRCPHTPKDYGVEVTGERAGCSPGEEPGQPEPNTANCWFKHESSKHARRLKKGTPLTVSEVTGDSYHVDLKVTTQKGAVFTIGCGGVERYGDVTIWGLEGIFEITLSETIDIE